ncbi:MAG: hypothetical protein KBT33_06745 [Prevotellaceae bacterium]|nr:hypothetical protein [Candidatus Minthosoma equi]
MANKKEKTEQSPEEKLLLQLSTTLQAQGSKNRERHNVVMQALGIVASVYGYTINEDDGTIVRVEKKAQPVSFSQEDKVDLARQICNMMPMPLKPEVIPARVDNSVHIQNNDVLMDELALRWESREDDIRKKQKADTESVAMAQVNKSVKDYFRERDLKDAKRKKRHTFFRKLKRIYVKFYGGYVSDKLKHAVAFSFGALGIIFGIVMYVSMTAYKASFDNEFHEYQTLRPFLINDRDYLTTIENMRELIRHEENKRLREEYDSISFEKYLKQEWEKRRRHQAEFDRMKQKYR